MKVSVIISTYNAPDWLEKVLWGFAGQTHKAFEIVIADDGSGPETKRRIEQLREQTGLEIQHVWHEDRGFQKSSILNKAIVAAATDYLIFTDGDCIPRKDFVATHVHFAGKGYFLSGGYCKLPMPLSKAITQEDIRQERAFNVQWLKQNGLTNRSALRKLGATGFWGAFWDTITPAKATWNGHNASGWKTDLVAANGFNEEMQYGGQDRELGERLVNAGIKPKQIRHRAIVIHLDHARGYKTPESMQKNQEIRRRTRREKITRTPYGIQQVTA